MLCELASTEILNNTDFIFEPKLDGTRALLYKAKDKIKFINRRQKRIDERYPEFQTKDFLKSIKADSAVLDGEIICYNSKGLPDFGLLQQREQISNRFKIEIRSKQIPATYVIFDILEKNGKSLIELPLSERKKILKKTIKEYGENSSNVELIYYTDNGLALWNEVKKKSLEGVIAKKKETEYYPGKRTPVWLKVKNLNRIDCIVAGFTEGEGIREGYFGSLAMALYKGKGSNKELYYIGRVGTGWDKEIVKDLHEKFSRIEINEIPVSNPPKNWRKYKIHWVKPKHVIEVEYLLLTKDNELRAPSFKGIREDKNPSECKWETELGE